MIRVLFVVVLCLAACAKKPTQAPRVTEAPAVLRPRPSPRLPIENLYFAFNSDTLKVGQVRQLGRVAGYMAATGTRITLTGYADTVGSDAYNIRLSLRRSMAVKTALVLAGAAESAIDPYGLGELKGVPAKSRKVTITTN